MKPVLTLLAVFAVLLSSAQEKLAGVLANHADIGHPAVKGNTIYHAKDKSYELEGGGYNIWFNRDEFQFAYKKMKGDFILTANFQLLDTGKEAHRKTGWMIRQSLDDSAVHISGVVHGDGLTVLQWRVKPGMKMRDPEDEIFAKEKNYRVIQLERRGRRIIMRAATQPGSAFVTIGEQEMENLADEVLAGIFICSHNPEVSERVKVSDVKVQALK